MTEGHVDERRRCPIYHSRIPRLIPFNFGYRTRGPLTRLSWTILLYVRLLIGAPHPSCVNSEVWFFRVAECTRRDKFVYLFILLFTMVAFIFQIYAYQKLRKITCRHWVEIMARVMTSLASLLCVLRAFKLPRVSLKVGLHVRVNIARVPLCFSREALSYV